MDEKKPYTIKYITKEQYEEIITKGSTVIDGETVSWGDNLSDKDSNDMFDETVIDTLKAKKLTDDEIVKALECCSGSITADACKGCPLSLSNGGVEACYYDDTILEKYALDLINRQKDEIERLKKRHGVALLRNDDLDLENYELKKQVDELKERAKIDLENERNWGKIQTKQAVKDTAKEIYDKCIAIDKATGCKGFVCIEAIAELAKGKGAEVE
jgi:regulator of replication initiation timing